MSLRCTIQRRRARARHTIGARGEDAAVRFLRDKKYRIVARNWYNPRGRRVGEIDIVARDDAWWVFVEVKTCDRAPSVRQSPPQERITASKLRKMHAVAQAYVRLHHLDDAPWRCDAISVYMRDDAVVRIDHLTHVFL